MFVAAHLLGIFRIFRCTSGPNFLYFLSLSLVFYYLYGHSPARYFIIFHPYKGTKAENNEPEKEERACLKKAVPKTDNA
jgi:hypothetical protein